MEALLREARQMHGSIPDELKEKIVLEHTPLIRYIVNRIAVRLPSHIEIGGFQPSRAPEPPENSVRVSTSRSTCSCTCSSGTFSGGMVA